MKQLKYLLLIPVLASMLLYSSCEINDLKSVEESVAKKELVTLYMNEGNSYKNYQGGKETYFDTYTLFTKDSKPNIDLYVLDYADLTIDEKAEFEERLEILKALENENVNYELSLYKLKNGRKIIVQRMNMERKEEKDYLEMEDVPFSVTDVVPTFPGCKDSDNLKDCFNESMQNFITTNFNTDISKDLGLEPGKQKIYVQFKILKTGEVEVIGIRAAHKDLEEEAKRVVNLLPKMIPGEHNGKSVNVTYMLPISFVVDGVVEEDANENNKGNTYGTIEYPETGEITYYVNMEKVSKAAYDKLKTENIKSVNVVKSKTGNSGRIEVTTKE